MSATKTSAKPFALRPYLRYAFRRLPEAIRLGVNRLRGRKNGAERDALATSPLWFADKTYNTAHPDYRPELARNFPNRIQNLERPCYNTMFQEIKKLRRRQIVSPRAWRRIYREVMEEARSVPGFDQVIERKTYIEKYLAELERRHQSHYVAGWVNLEDAQFLYWAVRQAKPKTIVQTGVSNGLSSAFMMLALAKNGPEGQLHVIDIPAIFDPNDPAWTQKDAVYGVVIPQGKSSGWIVPDVYRKRFSVEVGDAKKLLPPLVDRLDSIDMFFHDSDHTYDHMMFEFNLVMRKLAPDGVILADDISWNASLWDFADKHSLPSYNYRGTVGVAFMPGRREKASPLITSSARGALG
jgi:predicted O-methyltransferase YrrM